MRPLVDERRGVGGSLAVGDRSFRIELDGGRIGDPSFAVDVAPFSVGVRSLAAVKASIPTDLRSAAAPLAPFRGDLGSFSVPVGSIRFDVDGGRIAEGSLVVGEACLGVVLARHDASEAWQRSGATSLSVVDRVTKQHAGRTPVERQNAIV